MLGEGLGVAEAFAFEGFGGREFPVYVGFGAGSTGMEQTAFPDSDTTGGTGYGRKLLGGKVFHAHPERVRHAEKEGYPIWYSLRKIFENRPSGLGTGN